MPSPALATEHRYPLTAGGRAALELKKAFIGLVCPNTLPPRDCTQKICAVQAPEHLLYAYSVAMNVQGAHAAVSFASLSDPEVVYTSGGALAEVTYTVDGMAEDVAWVEVRKSRVKEEGNASCNGSSCEDKVEVQRIEKPEGGWGGPVPFTFAGIQTDKPHRFALSFGSMAVSHALFGPREVVAQVETVTFPKATAGFTARARLGWAPPATGDPDDAGPSPFWRIASDAGPGFAVRGKTPNGTVDLATSPDGGPVDVDATAPQMAEVTGLEVLPIGGGDGQGLPDATLRCTPKFLFTWELFATDHLGSVRAVAEVTKTGPGFPSAPVLKAYKDYEPYGFELFAQVPQSATGGVRFEFTGHERDEITGGFDVDYMGFRGYAPSLGRFLRPDNIPGNPLDPQSWNLYAYVNGNPVNFNDPTGHAANDPKQQDAKKKQGGAPTASAAEQKKEMKKKEGSNLGKTLKELLKKWFTGKAKTVPSVPESAPPKATGTPGAIDNAKALGSKANPASGAVGTLSDFATAAPDVVVGLAPGFVENFFNKVDPEDRLFGDREKAMMEARDPNHAGDALEKLEFLKNNPGFDHWPSDQEVLGK